MVVWLFLPLVWATDQNGVHSKDHNLTWLHFHFFIAVMKTMFLRWHKTLELGKTLHFVWKSLGGLCRENCFFHSPPPPPLFCFSILSSIYPCLFSRLFTCVLGIEAQLCPWQYFFSLFYIYYFIMLHVSCFILVISAQTSGSLSTQIS